MTPTRSLGRYKITYEKNGFVQYKNLVSYSDYENIIKPIYSQITDLEISLNKKNKEEVNKKVKDLLRQLKEQFGTSWFLDKSPLFDAITTGIISLPAHQGGDHKCKIEKV